MAFAGRQNREALARQGVFKGDENMKGIEKQFTSIQQMTDTYLKHRTDAADTGAQISFEEALTKAQTLKFSKHASMRLENRKISLSSEQSKRLESGVKKAGEKGIQDSLVIVDSLAFIVNVPNKTVVTAMDREEADEKIFTNIDGAVII